MKRYARLFLRGSRGGLGAALSACLVGLGILGLGGSPAAAQGFGFLGGLFGGGQQPAPQQAYPGYPGYGARQDYAPRRRPRHRQVDQQVQKEAPKETPANASIFVDVIGDSLGQLLANGLDDALSDRRDVAVVHKGRGSSGLVAEDYYDWTKAVDDLLASKDRIDVAVMMIGSNDRQPIRADGKVYAVGSDEWNALYKKRVLAIDEAFRKKGVPLIWVGVPITKNSDFADDMAAFNDIYREAAAKTGATYVDTWEAFSDDNGDFDAFGPDVNGQTVRLRTSDGIYFTTAGARKLAHFVESHIRRDLDGKAPTPVLPTGDGVATIGKPESANPIATIKPDAGPIKNLNEPPTASNGQLSQLMAPRDAARGDRQVETSLIKGEPQPAPAGRADDLRWSASAKTEP